MLIKDSARKYRDLALASNKNQVFEDKFTEHDYLMCKLEYATAFDIKSLDAKIFYKYIQLSLDIQNEELIANSYMVTSNYFGKLNNTDSQLHYLLLTFNQLKSRHDYFYLSSISKEIARVYESQKKYELQSKYLKYYAEYTDSVMVERNAKALKNAEVQYDVQKKEELNRSLQQEKATQIKLKNTFLYGGLLIASLLGTGLFFINRSKRRTDELNVFIQKNRLELQQSNDFKTKLLSIISHDLRSPITGLKMLMQLKSKGTLPAAEVQKLDDDILGMVNNASSSIDNVLSWAVSQQNTGAITIKPTNIDACIKEQIALMTPQAAAKQVTIKYTELLTQPVNSNADALNIIIRNLLNNAIKFSKPLSEVLITCHYQPQQCTLSIIDSGIGMDAQQIKQLGTYATTLGTGQEKGLGLGMQLVMEYCAKIGATHHIVSAPNKGTTINIMIPIA
jgi:two-component system, sensor histidine kinase and response regulator